MSNPFEVIDRRLQTIESLLVDIVHKPRHIPEPINPNERITRKEISEQYKVSLTTIHHHMNNGSLPFEKVGRKTLFKRSEVEKFFSSKK